MAVLYVIKIRLFKYRKIIGFVLAVRHPQLAWKPRLSERIGEGSMKGSATRWESEQVHCTEGH
jgi:hypothetical protein